jgi:hypothetical protein
MTATAAIKKSDLIRVASVAKAEGICIEVEMSGAILRFFPDIPAEISKKPLAPKGGVRL